MNSESHTPHDHEHGAHDHAPHEGRRGHHGHGPRDIHGFGPGFGGFGPRGFRPPGPTRKRRGDVRHAILSLLAAEPSNGYGLIKAIGERSGGTWNPSPGSVYPTLQQLVDEGLIESAGEGRASQYTLTDEGRAYATEHAEELDRLWTAAEQAAGAEQALHESVGKLMGAVHQLRFGATEEQRAKAVEALDEARRALYAILAD